MSEKYNNKIFIVMNINEEISRIKFLIENNISKPFIRNIGSVDKIPGLQIFLSNDSEDIGYTNLIDFNNSDYYFKEFPKFKKRGINGSTTDFFNNDNCLYLYGLRVNDEFRGQGYGHQLMNYCREFAQNLGKKFILLIVESDNSIAKNLYNKHGYQEHMTDGVKDFYFLEI